MSSRIKEIFEDVKLVEKIQKRLPYLFQLAEMESSRAGRMGMEVGSVREKIIVALLIYKFDEANVEAEIPITKSEVDVKLFGEPISIKTFTGKTFSSVKIAWTVDAKSAKGFREKYYPRCDILLIQINKDDEGGFYWIPLDVQRKVFEEMGREGYIKLPKPGTNPRGIEFSKEALSRLVTDKDSFKIPIYWKRTSITFNSYKRWVDLWRED